MTDMIYPGKRILRKMGYFSDQEGIIHRYIRESGAWDSHLIRCREYLLEKVREHTPDVITILGSGWLLDIPLEELTGHCSRINLVDVIHPAQVRHKVSDFSSVYLFWEDITGGLIKEVWDFGRRKHGDIGDMVIPAYEPGYNQGLVISMNILTQTDTLLADYLYRKGVNDNDAIRSFRAKVQRAHLDYLRGVPHLLVSDYEEIIKDKKEGTDDEVNKLLFTDIDTPGEKREWVWEFDNAGEYYRRKSVQFSVFAVDNVIDYGNK